MDLRTLGRLDLTSSDGTEVRSVLAQPKRTALLVYLALARPRGFHRRDTLVSLFWPEVDDARARRSLSQALSFLRQELPEEALTTRGADEVAVLSEALTVDVVAFESASDAGLLAEALEIYRGDFLNGFHAGDAWGFDEWASGERERLRERAADGAWALAREQIERGALTEAERSAQRALGLVPTDESAVRGFIEALAGAGDRAVALRFAGKFSVVLAEELEVEPSAETKAVVERIRNEEGASEVTSVASPASNEETGKPTFSGEPRDGMGDPSSAPQRNKRHWSVSRWALTAAASVVMLVMDALAEPLSLSVLTQQAILTLVGVGFFGTLVVAWYHGEKGRQRVSGPEWLLIALLLVIAGTWPTETAITAGEPEHPRTAIAVLPFQNLSADGPYAYFAGGLHDELLTQLGKVAALKVISRTSVMGYSGTDLPSLQQIAGELGVGSVVVASVQVMGNRLRVTVQLIDARTDEHLWADSYDRTLDDAFAIQSDVAQRVVVAVGATLGGSEQQSIAEAPTANAEAYRLYLQGQVYRRRSGYRQQDLESAQQLYEGALALDSTFALVHAELSVVHGLMSWMHYDTAPERLARQREEAETALRLAPELPRAHMSMGLVHYYRLDRQAALEEYDIALQGLPNDAWLWEWIGWAHRRLGNWDEVDAAYEKATQLDPRDADLFSDLGGGTYAVTRRYADAIAAINRALTLAPDLHAAAIAKGWVYLRWRGELDTLRVVLDQLPPDAAVSGFGTAKAQRARLLLLERKPDSLLALLGSAPEAVLVRREIFHLPSLYAAWAHELRGDDVAAYAAFDSARSMLDSVLAALPDASQVHAARGLALAGLGRRQEALREARWLQQSVIHREDAFGGPSVAEGRAMILAQAGEADAALDEIEQLLAGPGSLSVHTLRLDPRWDPIREHPRFQALLEEYGGEEQGD